MQKLWVLIRGLSIAFPICNWIDCSVVCSVKYLLLDWCKSIDLILCIFGRKKFFKTIRRSLYIYNKGRRTQRQHFSCLCVCSRTWKCLHLTLAINFFTKGLSLPSVWTCGVFFFNFPRDVIGNY